MRLAAGLAAIAPLVLGAPLAASAAPPAAPPSAPRRAPAPGFDERLVLDTGREPPLPPDPDKVSFTMPGSYDLRFRALRDLRLEAPVSDPGATTLGQNAYLYHWLRLSPRFQYRGKVAIVGQIDVPRGLVLGDTTRHVEQVRDSLSEARWWDVHPRYFYLELDSPIGLVRLGLQGSHWGMGLVANDGDHPQLFGDAQRGSISERLFFATSPMGKGTPLTLMIAGDLVFEDNLADLLGDDVPERPAPAGGEAPPAGDRAYQGVAAVLWRERRVELGLYGALRHQERDQLATGGLTPFTEELTAGVLDFTAKVNGSIPGANAFAYGQVEGAVILGGATSVRSAAATATDPAAPREPEKIRAHGGAATVGAVHVAGRGPGRWGRLVTEVELGYASGDADPYDGVSHRFTFDPNHNVGLVLFDHVLAWKTARAATIAQDPALVARPSPGMQLLPSKGGVFGAAYLNPRVVYRPVRDLDLKAGLVIAQTTADLVDPYHAAALGEIANYDGGDERAHDLGAEIDLGIERRIRVRNGTAFHLGAEGGVLFPGGAFDDASGQRLPVQALLNTKLGIRF